MNNIKNRSRNLLRGVTLDVLSMSADPSAGIHLMNSHLLTLKEELNSDYFDHQLQTISKKSTIIPFEEAVDLIRKQTKVNHSLIAFSFDDGFAECHSHIAPVLEKYNGYGCFFICPNFIDGDAEYNESFLQDKVHQQLYKQPMKWAEVRNLHDKGHIIGAHTMDHIRVSELTDQQELHYQIGACKEIISNHINSTCDYFAFTYGHLERDFNIASVEIAEHYYKNIFGASNWLNYYSYDGRIMNRRSCEPYWKASHINYFLSKRISY